ncbi:hypothetical protein OH77DRAFT_199807 [Trametes cingulata]|nr:hypothetical protein OH77DRAFT_199807 [Trametes cingulata]
MLVRRDWRGSLPRRTSTVVWRPEDAGGRGQSRALWLGKSAHCPFRCELQTNVARRAVRIASIGRYGGWRYGKSVLPCIGRATRRARPPQRFRAIAQALEESVSRRTGGRLVSSRYELGATSSRLCILAAPRHVFPSTSCPCAATFSSRIDLHDG